MESCECSEEFGPCEQHCEVLVSREGASLRTGDELAVQFIDDAVSLGVELSPWGKSVLQRAKKLLADNESMGAAWLPEGTDGDEVRDDMQTLEWQVKAELEPAVYREDGYRIVKITGGPLAED